MGSVTDVTNVECGRPKTRECLAFMRQSDGHGMINDVSEGQVWFQPTHIKFSFTKCFSETAP